jgi:dienelactone hydrolase
MDSFQYDMAARLARVLTQNNPSKKFIFTGHSLGGGLATVAAAVVNHDAVIFNPAGLDANYAAERAIEIANAEKNTLTYSVSGEILATLQNTTDSMSGPPGAVYQLPRPSYNWIQENISTNSYLMYGTRLGVALHGMDAVKQSFTELMERYHCN